MRKKLLFVISFCLIFPLIVITLPSKTSTYIKRYIWWNAVDIEDYRKFPERNIDNGEFVFKYKVSRSPYSPKMVI